jgi:hypothetical protein
VTRATLAGAAATVLPLLLLLLLLLAPTGALRAQASGVPANRPQLAARADVIAGRATAVQGALGFVLPFGTYVRGSAVAGGGTVSAAGETRGSARADVVARFLFDPFLERRWGPYGGAGVSAMYAAGARGQRGDWRGYLLAVAGVEGPPAHGFLPAVEVGLGGGTRVGIVLRRARAQGR